MPLGHLKCGMGRETKWVLLITVMRNSDLLNSGDKSQYSEVLVTTALPLESTSV